MHFLPHFLCRQQLVLGFLFCLEGDQHPLTAISVLIGGNAVETFEYIQQALL
jgi:hypothetical protein